jgi:hypothetical protein
MNARAFSTACAAKWMGNSTLRRPWTTVEVGDRFDR